jgi:hypothetical protein
MRSGLRVGRFMAIVVAVLILVPSSGVPAEDPLGLIRVDRYSMVARMPGETELSVSADGQKILVGINTPNSDAVLDRDTQYVSGDGGSTFAPSALADGDPGLTKHRDPTIARAGSGNFYYAAMGSRTNIVLGRSGDGGTTLIPTSQTAGDCKTFFGVADGCETDQPHIAADPRKNGNGDQLYVVWRASMDNATARTAVIECSTDSGATWSLPQAVWERDKGDFPRVTVDQKGRVWVVMVESSRRSGTIHVQRFSSCADGLRPAFVSFGQSSPAFVSNFDGDFCSGGSFISGLDRCNEGNIIASPTVAVDETHSDRVFVTWAQRNTGINGEIITVADEKAGQGGFPLRIRVDTDAQAAARFLPYSCAAGGQVFVGWYDRRRARAGLSTNDTTDYFVGAVGIRDLNLVRVPEVRVTPYSDPQCATWPSPSRQSETAEACTHQPQLAGILGGERCDFSDTADCKTERGAPKYGDYNGIACAGGKAFLTWASHVSPLRKDSPGGRPPRPGNLSVYFARATPDVARAVERARGDAFVYQLSNDGKLEKPIQQNKFARGVTIASPFSVGVDTFLFFLNTIDRGFKVNRLELAGTVGQQVDSKALSSGWTSVATYGILGSTYAFMYKSGSGFVKVRRIESGGVVTPSANSPSQNLEAGWTSVSHYAVGLDNFLLFVNASSGAMQVRRVNADGLAGESIQADTWTAGYTTVRPFSNAGGNFLFKLKAGNGTMHVERINDDGTTGSIIDNQTFETGFKVGIPYNVAGGTFVLLLNPDTGILRIRRITDSGIVDAVTDEREFTTGWKTAAIYTVVLGKYLALIKP